MAKVLSAPAVGAAGALFVFDILAAALAWPVALALLLAEAPRGVTAGLWMLMHPAAYIIFLYSLGLYRRDVLVEPRRGFARVPVAAALGSLAASVLLAMLPAPEAAPRPGALPLFA
ncbi:hypothetical protein, partial [Falsiroseomonas oryzae]|uniref:hypothetical protein n=1 Tax=Falsiroseomonas oryzae TaxID=2766473 RepID=UPI0022EB9C1E